MANIIPGGSNPFQSRYGNVLPSNRPPQTTRETPTPAATTSHRRSTPTNAPTTTTTTGTPIIVQAGGGVKVGGTTYSGSAEVPGTGMTTQQFGGQARENIKSSMGVSSREASRYNVTYVPTTMTTTSKQTIGNYPGREQLLSGVPMIAGGMKDTSGSIVGYKPASSSISMDKKASGVVGIYLGAESWARQKITYPIGSFISGKIGITIEKTGESFKTYQTLQMLPQSIISQRLFGKDIYRPSIQLGGEFVKSYITEYKEKPVKQALFIGAGGLLSFGLKAVNVGTIYGGAKIGSVFGGIPGAVKGASIARTAVQVGTIGAGLGLTGIYSYNVGSRLISAKSAGERGTILGKEGAMLTSIGIGSYAGMKLSDIGIGYLRTRGTKNIPYEDIVDPSRLKYEKGMPGGQKYPQIKRGQTAGQLKAEFIPQLPGETKPASWTASPTSFMKQTIIQKGSSELPAGYGAPKLNPQFFGGEEIGLFGFNVPSGMKTAIRGTPEGGFALFPGVKYGQTSFIKITPEQFLAKAKPGVSYITFIKGEKEALTVSGTYAEQTAVRYSSKTPGLLGFRFPVQEVSYKTGGGTVASSNTMKAITSYYSGAGRNYVYNPASSGLSYAGISKYKIPSYSSVKYSAVYPSMSYSTSSSSYSIPYSISRSITRGSRSSGSSYSRGSSYYMPSYSGLRISPSYKSYTSTPRYSQPYYSSYMFSGFSSAPALGFGTAFKLKSFVRKQPKMYQVSLAARELNLKSFSIPKGITTGLVRRPIIRKKRRRK